MWRDRDDAVVAAVTYLDSGELDKDVKDAVHLAKMIRCGNISLG